MTKKISEMTAEEIQNRERKFGVEGMPYPLPSDERDEEDGQQKMKIGVVNSVAKPMVLYSEKPLEEIWGELYRDMPIPSMLQMLRDLTMIQLPTSKNRLLTVLGDPSFGKTYLFESFARLIHPQGALCVDCGGMNMHEIFFRTVIDYGAGTREVLDKRLAEGRVSQSSIDYLKTTLGSAAVIEKDGKAAIDWDMVGIIKPLDGIDEEPEDHAARARKEMNNAIDALKHVYEKEGIIQQTNSFGIKTVPGVMFEAYWEGRPLLLDEITKANMKTFDNWQRFLQFLNGEKDSIVIPNLMATSDDPLKEIHLSRDDMRLGFIVCATGNESKDGETTHDLPYSTVTRVEPLRVGNATERDWEHRWSREITGLPLVTLRNIFQDFAAEKPVEFTEFLLSLRKMGLSAEEQAAIPNEEIDFLQNWQSSVKAIEMLSKFYFFRTQLSDRDSALFEKDEYANLADEINSDARAEQIAASFRKIAYLCNKARIGMPKAEVTTESIPNISEALEMARLPSGSREPGWYHYGANLAQAIKEEVYNVTKDMPQTRAAMLTVCEEMGIVAENFDETRASDSFESLSDLMKYDELKDMGGTDELRAVQGVVMAALRSMYKGMEAPDDEIVPLANLGRVLQDMKDEDGTKADSEVKEVIIPNDDLNQVKAEPLVAAEAVANYNNEESGEGVDFRSVLAAMALPDYADKNRDKLWLSDLLDYMKQIDEQLPDLAQCQEEADGLLAEAVAAKEAADRAAAEASASDKAAANKAAGVAAEFLERAKLTTGQTVLDFKMEILNTLMGKSKNGFHLAIASAVNTAGEPVYLYVLEDRRGGQALIVGPEGIDVHLDSALKRNGVTYMVKTDPATAENIDKFLTEGTRGRQKKGAIPKGTSNEVTESLISAFGRVCVYPQKYLISDEKGGYFVKAQVLNEDGSIKEKGATLGTIIVDTDEAPAVYTRFVRKPKPTMK